MRDESYGGPGAGSSVGSAAGSLMKALTKPKAGGVGRRVAKTAVRTATRRLNSPTTRNNNSYSNSGRSSVRTPVRTSANPVRKGMPKPPTSGKPNVKPKVPTKPTIPSIDSYLGTDTSYQDVVRGGRRSLADFLSELGRRKGEAETQYGTTKSSMERDRVQQLESLRDEFASRGLINSGLFGEEQGNFQQQFQQQQTALEQQQASLLADLLSQETNYKREQELALEAAKQEALQRRAAKFKIGA